jgi:hypothetical protein
MVSLLFDKLFGVTIAASDMGNPGFLKTSEVCIQNTWPTLNLLVSTAEHAETAEKKSKIKNLSVLCALGGKNVASP